MAGLEKEMKMLRQRAGAAFSMSCRAIYENKRIRLRTKLKMYVAMVLSCLLYACATWPTTQAQIAQLETTQMRCLRRIFGLRWYNKISYIQMLAQAKQVGVEILPVEVYISERRLRYLGHMECMGVQRLPYQVLHGEVLGGK